MAARSRSMFVDMLINALHWEGMVFNSIGKPSTSTCELA